MCIYNIVHYIYSCNSASPFKAPPSVSEWIYRDSLPVCGFCLDKNGPNVHALQYIFDQLRKNKRMWILHI